MTSFFFFSFFLPPNYLNFKIIPWNLCTQILTWLFHSKTTCLALLFSLLQLLHLLACRNVSSGACLWHIVSLPLSSQSIVNRCQWHNWRKWLPLGRQNLIWCILGKNWIEENEENYFLLNIADIVFIRSHENLLYDLTDIFFKNWNNWKLLNNILFIFFFYLICNFLLWETTSPWICVLFILTDESFSFRVICLIWKLLFPLISAQMAVGF